MAISCGLVLAASSGQSNANDEAESKVPTVAPAPGEAGQGPSSPSYWSGSYWDAQDGKGFWQRLKPNSRRSQKAKADDEPTKPAINGSVRTRNENRARQR